MKRPLLRIDQQRHLIESGETLLCGRSGWRDAFVVVDRGPVELITPAGDRLVLAPGASFSVALIGTVLVRNTTAGPAELIAVRRIPDQNPKEQP